MLRLSNQWPFGHRLSLGYRRLSSGEYDTSISCFCFEPENRRTSSINVIQGYLLINGQWYIGTSCGGPAVAHRERGCICTGNCSREKPMPMTISRQKDASKVGTSASTMELILFPERRRDAYWVISSNQEPRIYSQQRCGSLWLIA